MICAWRSYETVRDLELFSEIIFKAAGDAR
jgi:hypothetical protein